MRGIPRSSGPCGAASSKTSRFWAQSLVVVPVVLLVRIISVDAISYSEICYAGPRYKVRLDTITGAVVPVFDNFTEIDDDIIDDDFPWYEYPFNNDPFVSQAYPPGGSENKDAESSEDIGIHRWLRYNRFWGNNILDEDSETDATVVKIEAAKTGFHLGPENLRNVDPSVPASYPERFRDEERRYQRFLQDGSVRNGEDDLEENEFYVKPCLCSTSRWTFWSDHESSSNIETNSTSGFPINRFNIPHNFGRHSNGKHVYVPDNRENGDLYLCHAGADFCAVSAPLIGEEGTRTTSGTIVKCYDQTTKPTVVRNAWPFVWVLYWGLAVCCCCTFHGRVALGFVLDRLVRCCKRVLCCFGANFYDYNDRMLQRMIDDEESTGGQNSDGSTDSNDENVGNIDAKNESKNDLSCCSNRRLKFERKVLAQIRRPTGEESTFQAWLYFLGFKSTT